MGAAIPTKDFSSFCFASLACGNKQFAHAAKKLKNVDTRMFGRRYDINPTLLTRSIEPGYDYRHTVQTIIGLPDGHVEPAPYRLDTHYLLHWVAAQIVEHDINRYAAELYQLALNENR
jgi:hypothetical protein